MGIKWAGPPLTLHEFIMSDTLDNLFRCPGCDSSLIKAIVYAESRRGVASRVECPVCHTLTTFVRVPSDLYEKEPLSHKDLAEISQTVTGLARTIASRVGRCARCGRELTNPDSIARGLGPDCAEKVGPEGRKAAFWGSTYHGNN